MWRKEKEKEKEKEERGETLGEADRPQPLK